MLWGKKAPAAEAEAGASGSSEKKKKKYEKQVWYGSPLDRRAFLVEEANRRMAAEKVTFVSELKALFLPRRRLRLDPQKHLYFIIHEPNKHVASAITIKNVSKSHVAFKFQTTVPHSCFMRPNGGVLAPKEEIIATVTKFVEKLESEKERKTKEKKEKFKIISVPVQPDVDYYPDMFEDDEDNVSEERILEVVFIASNKASSEQVNKLQRRLAEADAAEEARKKSLQEAAKEEVEEENVVAPIQEGQGQVINAWKQRREAFLAQQQAGGQKPS